MFINTEDTRLRFGSFSSPIYCILILGWWPTTGSSGASSGKGPITKSEKLRRNTTGSSRGPDSITAFPVGGSPIGGCGSVSSASLGRSRVPRWRPRQHCPPAAFPLPLPSNLPSHSLSRPNSTLISPENNSSADRWCSSTSLCCAGVRKGTRLRRWINPRVRHERTR